MTLQGYGVKYDPEAILAEYQDLINRNYKSNHAVSVLSQKFNKRRSTIYLIINKAKKVSPI